MRDIRAGAKSKRRGRIRSEKVHSLLEERAEARRICDREQEERVRKRIKKVLGPPPYCFVVDFREEGHSSPQSWNVKTRKREERAVDTEKKYRWVFKKPKEGHSPSERD